MVEANVFVQAASICKMQEMGKAKIIQTLGCDEPRKAKSEYSHFLFLSLQPWHSNPIQSLGMFVCEQKGFSAVHSHRLLLPLSWESLKVLNPTEFRGCGGDQQYTMTLAR